MHWLALLCIKLIHVLCCTYYAHQSRHTFDLDIIVVASITTEHHSLSLIYHLLSLISTCTSLLHVDVLI